MNNDIPPDNVVKQKNEYYLDPYFFGRAKTKGELLQCFTQKNKPLTYKDLDIHQKVFYRIKASCNKELIPNKGIPVAKEVLKVFQLKSFPIIMVLLKIALHKQLSIGKCQQLYKQVHGKYIKASKLLVKLSTQKALCVQITDHILQIAYGKKAGLVLADGTSWKPQPTQFHIDNLARAREIQETKRVFLPLPKDYFERQEESIQATNDYFADLEWERARELA